MLMPTFLFKMHKAGENRRYAKIYVTTEILNLYDAGCYNTIFSLMNTT